MGNDFFVPARFIRWHHEDDEFLGWSYDKDMMTDPPDFVVLSPEPGVWAGWVYNDDRTRYCVTSDHSTAHDAQRELAERVVDHV